MEALIPCHIKDPPEIQQHAQDLAKAQITQQ